LIDLFVESLEYSCVPAIVRPNDLKREFPHLLYPGLSLLMVVFASIGGHCKAFAKHGLIASHGFCYSFVLIDVRAAAAWPQAILLETVMTAVKEPHFLKTVRPISRQKIDTLWQGALR